MRIQYGNYDGEVPCLKLHINSSLPELGRRYRKAVIVLPGGSYESHSERECEAVALRFQAYGCQAFVLRYSLLEKNYIERLEELAETIATIRQNSELWDIDENKIVLCGFSAGGHLAASMGNFWNSDMLSVQPKLCRPNGIILGYPVITMGKYAHIRTSGSLADDVGIKYASAEKFVNQNTPPHFIWHTVSDEEVPVMNSLLYAEALSEQSVPFELLVFPEGRHGLSLADNCTAEIETDINETCAQWFPMALKWMENQL